MDPENFKLLLWCWGRRGASVRIAHEFASAWKKNPSVRLMLSLSHQSELFAKTADPTLPSFHVDTFTGAMSALYAAVRRLPSMRREAERFAWHCRPDVVVAVMRHVFGPAILPVFRALGARVLLIVHDATPHPGESYPFWRHHLRLDLAPTDGVIALSDHVRERLTVDYRYPPNRIWLASHHSMQFTGVPAHERQLPKDRPVRLLFFGRLLPYKGLDILVDAYTRLAARYPVSLTVAGSGDLGALAALAGRPDVRLERRWIQEDEIGRFLAEADILLVPYREASQSGVVPSAYAAGLPVVATPVGGLKEQVRHENTGLIASSVDAAAFAACVARLLDEPVLYHRCSKGALALATGPLNIDTVTDYILTVARYVATLPPR
ncbi:MAG TPA: glycosyltransferase family 4 protein [Xanthobacteraceae bacterium]|nr:glycosyltransferase family 4 protein [Xanthobacteraceae bacterium]